MSLIENGKLTPKISNHTDTEKALRWRLGFEALLLEISSDFINLPLDKIDEGIEQTLKKIGTFSGSDAGYVFMFSDNYKKYSLKHLWKSPASQMSKDRLHRLESVHLPWWVGLLLKNKQRVICSVDDLPPEAKAEKEHFKSLGYKSLIDVPMIFMDKMVGFVGFSCNTHEKKWSNDEISLLKLVGQIITNAIKRKETDLMLHSSEKKFRVFFDNSYQINTILSVTGEVMDINRTALNFISKRKKDIIGLPFWNTPFWNSSKEEQKRIKEAVLAANKGEIFRCRLKSFNHQNLQRYIDLALKPVKDDLGEVKFLSAEGRDITEQVQAEQEAEKQREQLIQVDKMASLGILVSGVAHEINNPTNIITLNAPLLRQVWEDTKIHLDRCNEEKGGITLANLPYSEMQKFMPELLNGVEGGAKRISNIVNSLRDYARQSGTDLSQDVDLNQVVDESLKLLGNLIRKSTKQLNLIKEKNLPKVKGNFQRIEQVVVNIIQNACQALKNPNDAISIKTIYDEVNHQAILMVEDQGSGISKEDKKHILDPFFTTKRDIGGTGLGLSISAGIIKDHNGRLDIESQKGEGTTMIISLPAQ